MGKLLSRFRPSHRLWLAALAAVAVLVAIAAILLSINFGGHALPHAVAPRRAAAAGPPAATAAAPAKATATPSVAANAAGPDASRPQPGTPVVLVMPFTAGEDAALAQQGDALAANITLALSRIPRLAVAVPEDTAAGNQGKGQTAQDIARKLGADYIIEGGLHHAENEVTISVQLIEAKSSLPLWTGVFGRAPSETPEQRDALVKQIVSLTSAHLRNRPQP